MKARQKPKTISITALFIAVIAILWSVSVFAQQLPEAATTVDKVSTSRRLFNTTGAKSLDAFAGNITEVYIYGVSQTQSWQGYVGDIEGTVTLDDANNYTLYNWSLLSPQGEVYVSNSSAISFADGNLNCLNFTSLLNSTQLETDFGVLEQDVDGVNETFCVGCPVDGSDQTPNIEHPEFYIGLQQVTQGQCWSTNMFEYVDEVGEMSPGSNFTEVLMFDNSTMNPVYVAIIEDNDLDQHRRLNGYDNETYNFEIMVLEDGHDGDNAITQYYFYVELQ